MSGINQPTPINIEDPEFYTELLVGTSRIPNRWLLSNSIQNVDPPLSWRLQTLLDVVADISIRQRGNVSAVTASLKEHKGTLETVIYMVFNHGNDEAGSTCRGHLESIIKKLQKVPYMTQAMDGSPKLVQEELEENLIEICKTIHNFSFEVFAYRVNKHKDRLETIMAFIQDDQTHFSHNNRSTLLDFFEHMTAIINAVDKAQATKQLGTKQILMLRDMHAYWMKNNLLPSDPLAHDQLTLLDNASEWLRLKFKIEFQLRHWAVKIMSFMISANKLVMLTQSRRLRIILDGKFSIHVLASPIPTPYLHQLTPETCSEAIKMALDATLAGSPYLSEGWDQGRKEFIKRLEAPFKKELKAKAPEVARRKFTVHAELALLMAKVRGDINDVAPYIGVSKLSCIMCSNYIRAFNTVTSENIATKGSRGKAYPGWCWPSYPSRDKELRPTFVRLIRDQLRRDFEDVTQPRRLSDSSVGSNGPEMELNPTRQRIRERIKASRIKASDD